MTIITKVLAVAALLFAVALPVTAASAACATDPYCTPDTPNAGNRDNDRGGSGGGGGLSRVDDDDDRGGVGGGGGGGGGGEVGGAGEETTGGAGGVESDAGVHVPADEDVPEAGVLSASVEAPRSAPAGTLPITGGDVVQLALLGVGAVGVGAVLVRRSRAGRSAA